ncbi:MAG: Rab family GTPase [Promethearchaeota archaeon]
MMSSWIFKVIVAGAGGVGKTAMVTRYCTGKFEDGYKMTIGAGFHTKSEILDTGESVKMQLWDFAGEKRFRELLPDYCKGASGGLICFDITDYDTFRDIPVWLKIIRQKAGFVPIILIRSKSEMQSMRFHLIERKYKCQRIVSSHSKMAHILRKQNLI